MNCAILIGVFIMLRSCHEGPSTPQIIVTSAMRGMVNAETPGNGIPWFKEDQKYSVKLNGEFYEESVLAQATKGQWSYTLYKITYLVTKVLEGEFKERELSFLIERKFPGPGSMIQYKDLWPFRKDKVLVFKLQEGMAKNLIVSIEQ